MIRLENIELKLKSGKSGLFMPAKRSQILKNISLELPSGKQTWLLGESGSGKSSLLRIINSSENDFTGSVFLNGKRVGKEISGKEAKKQIAYIPQDQHVWLDRNLTARDYIQSQNETPISDEQIVHGFAEFFETSIEPDRTCGSFSGGQAQILVLLGALFRNASVLLADNSLSSLDPRIKELVLKKFKKESEQKKNTVVLCSNDLQIARKEADWILLLRDGEIAEFTSANDFFESPSSEYGKYFLEQGTAKGHTLSSFPSVG